MPGLVVMVTGVNRFLGSELAGRLAAHPAVARVIGVDATLPDPAARTRMGGAEFTRADIRNPLISRILEAAGVDTVVHASASASPVSAQARTLAKEMNVLGTMQLLAACQRYGGVRTLIARSTTAVYGQSSRDPAICTEATEPRSVPGRGPARDAIDIEGYVRGFARRRPDVRVAIPRLAEVVGPTVQTPLTRYFGLAPVVPTVFGHDVRLQLVHESDAVGLLEHLVFTPFRGTVNVAGDGVLMLSQAIHRAGRIPLPLPQSLLHTVGRSLRSLRLGGFAPEQVAALLAGRVVDTTRLRTEVGFTPRYSTAAAFDDFAAALRPTLDPDAVHRAELKLRSGLGVAAGAETRDAAFAPDAGRALDAASATDVPTVAPTLVGIDGDRAGVRAVRTGRRARR